MEQYFLKNTLIPFIQAMLDRFEQEYKAKSEKADAVNFEEVFNQHFFGADDKTGMPAHVNEAIQTANGNRSIILYAGVDNKIIKEEFMKLLRTEYRHRGIVDLREAFFLKDDNSNAEQYRKNIIKLAYKFDKKIQNHLLPDGPKVYTRQKAAKFEALLRKVFGDERFEKEIKKQVFSFTRGLGGKIEITITLTAELKQEIENTLAKMNGAKLGTSGNATDLSVKIATGETETVYENEVIFSLNPQTLEVEILKENKDTGELQEGVMEGDEELMTELNLTDDTSMEVMLNNSLKFKAKVKFGISVKLPTGKAVPGAGQAKLPQVNTIDDEKFDPNLPEDDELPEEFLEGFEKRRARRKRIKAGRKSPQALAKVKKPGQVIQPKEARKAPLPKEDEDQFGPIKGRFKFGPQPRKNLSRRTGDSYTPHGKRARGKGRGADGQGQFANNQIPLIPLREPEKYVQRKQPKKSSSFKNLVYASAGITSVPALAGGTAFGIDFLGTGGSGEGLDFLASSLEATSSFLINFLSIFIV